MAQDTMNILYSASGQKDIEDWASHQGTSHRILAFDVNGGKKVIALLIDVASGVTRENIFVYVLENSKWHLCLLRITNTHVEVQNTKQSLVFKSKSGSVLVEQPFATLEWNTPKFGG